MTSYYYSLYCEICGFRKKIEDPNMIVDMVEYKTAPINRGFINKRPPINQAKKYKCTQCGRVVTLKRFENPIEEKKDEKNQSS